MSLGGDHQPEEHGLSVYLSMKITRTRRLAKVAGVCMYMQIRVLISRMEVEMAEERGGESLYF